ncbi:MAG: DUF465 domain-containing protein [Deltaproteobacteria bacterium]|nr:DUF465 domain-containing protein [Deltaproteobacteria bacterium]
MTTNSATDDVTSLRHRLDVLLREHAEVKARVAEYQQRRWLSPGEQLELRTLQRLKLKKKDAIAALEKDLTLLESHSTFE